VARLRPNTDLPLTVLRQGVEERLTAKITERPAEEQVRTQTGLWPGMLVLPLTEQTRTQLRVAAAQRGVVVADVDEQSAAGTAGARPGDVILQMNGSNVASAADFYRLLGAAGSREVTLRVLRQGSEVSVTFRK
jgi:S1-C subfamily serine protease